MEIKTCEEYVLAELENYKNMVDSYQDKLDLAAEELDNKSDEYIKLLDSYRKLSYENKLLKEIIRGNKNENISESK